MPSHMSQKAAALIVGLNYNTASIDDITPLNATISDATRVRELLRDIGYDDIVTCTDVEVPFTTEYFTIKLKEFVKKTIVEDLDRAVFYYSGHGATFPLKNSKESSDECIVTSDGLVFDDQIRNILQEVNPRTRFIIIADCCNSGTLADLSYLYSTPEKWVLDSDTEKLNANIIMLSSCTDDQFATEGVVDFLSVAKSDVSGYLTGILLKVLNEHPDCRNSALALFRLVQNYFSQKFPDIDQTPQLSSSFKLTEWTPFF